MNEAAVRGGAVVVIEGPDSSGRIVTRTATVLQRSGRRARVRFDDGEEADWEVGLFASTVGETTAREEQRLELARIAAELERVADDVLEDGGPTVKLPGAP